MDLFFLLRLKIPSPVVRFDLAGYYNGCVSRPWPTAFAQFLRFDGYKGQAGAVRRRCLVAAKALLASP
jgi:hypothetical protein